jgi:glucokinase
MKYSDDRRIVLTLDAGGTNFVYSAIQGNKEIMSPLTLPSRGHDLEECLNSLVEGFTTIRASLPDTPVAISFAFPGPADYPAGIIGKLANLPAFTGGIALGPMLAERFAIPVFINNDGDLFVYGEAIAGFLPWVNDQLEKAGSPKRYENLFGITIGTGFGAGLVRKGELFLGDNSNGMEIWITRNRIHPDCFAEEGASIRAILREYRQRATMAVPETLTPKDIYDIAMGEKKGDVQAAREAFRGMARVAGDAAANAITLLDGLIVVGGGLAGAYPLFGSWMVEEMNGDISNMEGKMRPRIVQKAYNLENEGQRKEFLVGSKQEIIVPGSQRKILYDPMKRIGVGMSKLGTSRAVSLGAYAFALNEIDRD